MVCNQNFCGLNFSFLKALIPFLSFLLFFFFFFNHSFKNTLKSLHPFSTMSSVYFDLYTAKTLKISCANG